MNAFSHVPHTLAAVTAMLLKNGHQFEAVSSGDGALLLLPKFGRVLGLWSDTNSGCHFWINPQLLMSDATEFFSDDAHWANPGGHRIWIAPERELFIKDLSRPEQTYFVPACIDPGCYSYKKNAFDACLENRGHAYAHASNIDIPFKLSRRIRALENEEIQSFAAGVPLQGAGYEEHTVLELDECCPIRAGVWSLAQVEPGGIVLVPLRSDTRYTVFFGRPDDAVLCEGRLLKVHFQKQQKKENIFFKVGLKASWTSNTIVYFKDNKEGLASVTVKVFEIADDTHYVDTPWQLPEDYGYAVQFFYGTQYGFGELETHAPVVKGSRGQWQSVSRSSVYAFCGCSELCNNLITKILQKS